MSFVQPAPNLAKVIEVLRILSLLSGQNGNWAVDVVLQDAIEKPLGSIPSFRPTLPPPPPHQYTTYYHYKIGGGGAILVFRR